MEGMDCNHRYKGQRLTLYSARSDSSKREERGRKPTCEISNENIPNFDINPWQLYLLAIHYSCLLEL